MKSKKLKTSGKAKRALAKIKNLNDYDKFLTLIEGGKVSLSVAQVKEVRSKIGMTLLIEPRLIAMMLMAAAKRVLWK